MTRKTRNLIISYAAILTTAFAMWGTHTAIEASATEGDTPVQITTPFDNFQMINGASVRYNSNNTATNGLRFGVALSKDTYAKMASDYSAYTNVTYGVLIAPDDMLTTGKELNEANVFGSSAIYDWAEWSDEKGWVYNGQNGENGSKKRIINLTSTQLTQDTYDNNLMSYYGAIIDIQDEVNGVNNLAREFRGVGYVSYTYDNQQKYVFVGDEDNVRSMAYVAQIAIEKNHANSAWLQTNYVDKVTNVQSDYTVEYYLQQGDTYVKDEDASVVKTDKTIDDEVTAEEKTFDGYEFDSTNANNVVSGKVLANGKLVLKRYYKVEEEIFDSAVEDSTLNLADTKGTFDFMQMLTDNEKTDAVNVLNSTTSLGELTWEIDGQKVTNVSALEGIYDITAKRGETIIYTGRADFYNSDDGMVWVDNTNLSLESVCIKNTAPNMTKAIATENLPTNAKASQYYYVTDGDTASNVLSFAICGVHSKAYYQMWKDKGVDNLLIDVYYTSTVCTSTATYFYVHSTSHQNINKGQWSTLEISLATLIEKFDNLSNGAAEGQSGIKAGSNTYDFQMYLGNFRGA